MLALLAACSDSDKSIAPASTDESQPNEFRPAFTQEHNQRQHRRFPQDDIWWTAYGDDQEWNFRNVHQFFPTVNVYRDGQVSELPSNPNPAIADHLVDTPAGPMTFDDLLHSDMTTAMGVELQPGQDRDGCTHGRTHGRTLPITISNRLGISKNMMILLH